MKVRTFKGGIETNKQGSTSYFEFEVEEGATEEEIQEVARECAFELIDYWYEEVK